MDILGIGLGGDAMAEVEDMGTIGKGLDNALGLRGQARAALDQQTRVEVTLNAAVFLDLRRRPARIGELIERHAIADWNVEYTVEDGIPQF